MSVQLEVTLSRPEWVATRPWLAFQAKAMLKSDRWCQEGDTWCREGVGWSWEGVRWSLKCVEWQKIVIRKDIYIQGVSKKTPFNTTNSGAKYFCLRQSV